MDFSTIDIEALKRFPTFRLPGAMSDDAVSVHIGKVHWSLQQHPGNGCSGDPPGYPTYFTRTVYKNGDYPHSGPTLVITYEGKHYVIATWDDSDNDVVQERLHALWKPLPFDHERVQRWVRDTYRHHRDCYHDEHRIVADDISGVVIYPVPSYKLKHFVDDTRFSDEWRDKAMEEVEAYNDDIETRTKKIATPENHQAHYLIRRFYPEARPRHDLIAKPPTMEGQWWETEAKQPAPNDCKPRNGIGALEHVGEGWCQWCGWAGDA